MALHTVNDVAVLQPGSGGTYTKVNGTGVVVGFRTSDDGAIHLVTVAGVTAIATLEAGGAMAINYTLAGVARSTSIDAGTHGVGSLAFGVSIAADPGTLVTIQQTSALTSGASTVAFSVAQVN